MSTQTLCYISVRWISVFILTLSFFISAPASFALGPRPSAKNAEWSGQPWGEVQIVPAITKPTNSVTVIAKVIGGPAGIPVWSCSQYSAWIAHGTSGITIGIPADWKFTMGAGAVDGSTQYMSETRDAGDPPPYGWEDRISDTCYCYTDYFGAHGGCASGEVRPTLYGGGGGNNYQQEVLATAAHGEWTGISARFDGWVGVGWSDHAFSYLAVIDGKEEREDNDDDGLWDAWEVVYFGDLTTADASTDYDGDGLTDLTEFNKWDKNRLDAKGVQYDPTFVNSASGCTATTALKEDSSEKDLRILRQFRDEVLSKTPAGQKLIRLYYAWSPVIVEAMEEDENFMKQVQKIFDGIMPLVEKAVQ